jgi:hypothetical protein
MVTNLGFYFETQKEVRGGKFVWWGDTNPTLKKNQLLGGDLLNPKKGFDHFYAGQLGKYVPGGGLSEDQEGITIYRAFAPKAAATASTTIVLKATGWDDAPEEGMIVMVAPNTATTTGQSAKITAVEYDKENEQFTITVDEELTVALTDILVEATGTAASASAKPLVDYVNMWILADEDLMPTDGYGLENANYSISTVYNKQAWIVRMQPLPEYVLAKNKSNIDGIFWI